MSATRGADRDPGSADSDDPARQPDDATPLTAEERDGLKLSHIVLRRELNEAEQSNILKAEAGLFGRRTDPVKESYGRALHKKMFGDVWRWAGRYRTSDKNLGVRYVEVLPSLYKVYDDTAFWLAKSVFDTDEIAARFHHGLVVVHPFANGNGRWSRLMADLLLHRCGRNRFTSGRLSLADPGETRAAYLAALRAADRHEFAPLIAFMRS